MNQKNPMIANIQKYLIEDCLDSNDYFALSNLPATDLKLFQQDLLALT